MHAKSWTWVHYYWILLAHLGREVYRTWRWELFASVPVGCFVAILSGNWKDFKTATAATGLTLGCFVLWHLIRLPWLVHKSIHHTEEKEPGSLAGMLGVLAIAGVFVGGYEFAVAIWNSRPTTEVTMTIHAFPSAPAPTISKTPAVSVVHGACRVTEADLNPARSQQICTGGTGVPSLRDRVLALNAHLTESDRNRFSNALSEFEDSGKRADEIMSNLNIELGNIQRAQQSGTFAKEIAKHQKALSDAATEAKNYHADFYQLMVKWQTLFSIQEDYVFGDNPFNKGSSLLVDAPTGYENYLESWKAIANKENPATLKLLLFPMAECQNNLNDFGKWRSGWRQHLSEMRDSIR